MPDVVDRSGKNRKRRLGVARARIQTGSSHDPFEALGTHIREDSTREVSVFLPNAEKVKLNGVGQMERIPGSDCFVLELKASDRLDKHYQLTWEEKQSGRVHQQISPYTFDAQIGDLDLHLFQEGRHHHAWRFLGSHLTRVDGVD
ncbi:MAG: hypothetical protein R3308_06345, partial [Thiohalobacterales bacterium]|nr:hypothetical protein [Thiohalobacterales bacterium]